VSWCVLKNIKFQIIGSSPKALELKNLDLSYLIFANVFEIEKVLSIGKWLCKLQCLAKIVTQLGVLWSANGKNRTGISILPIWDHYAGLCHACIVFVITQSGSVCMSQEVFRT